MSKLLWTPSQAQVEDANITKFITNLNTVKKLNLKDYGDLYEWSIKDVGGFWEAVWQETGIISSQNYSNVVENLEKFPPTTKWFEGSKLNFAENLLRFRDDQAAFIFQGETKGPIAISYKELYRKVGKVYLSLKQMGIKPGDRIAGYMPNLPETAIAMLAATSLGATWSSCGAELGADAALDRLGQIEPKVIFSVDGYFYKEKQFTQLKKLNHLVENIPSIEKVVIASFISEDQNMPSSSKFVFISEFMSDENDIEIEFEQLPFDHPLYIMFSSGTTGKPKCMVQGAGGVLINHLKELVFHTDLKRTDRLMYITSPSWMMWNWLISGLATGTTIILWEGNPLHPDWGRMWKLIEDLKITIFGCSASYLHYIKSIEAKPGKDYDLSSLRQISQTGSALSPEGFEYVYSEIKSDLHYNSISGGTDINGCFAAGSPTLPVYSGESQAVALGMKVKAYDGNAEDILNDQGELVCELPSPSMPVYFWNDETHERYQKAYFTHYTDRVVWRHGDYITINGETGGVTFYGRSDATLKPSGVRIGTSEIYNIVEDLSEIADSLAIGQQWKNDQRVLLFVQMSEGHELTEELIQFIKTELRTKASPRHVPALILQVSEIPYTFSGKKVESSITNILHGRQVTNRGALRNPEALDRFSEILETIKE